MLKGQFLRVGLLGCAVALGGCSGLLNNKASVMPTNNVQVNNELTMPPDLSLRAPGTGAAPQQQASASDADIYAEPVPSSPKPAAPGQLTRGQAAAGAGAQGDIFDQYGISKFKPDGTKKKDWELKEELRLAILKRKQQQNKNYGTVFNMGNIWSDQ